MGFLETEDGAAWPRGGELERSSRDRADPQGAHEFQAGKPAQVVGVPFAECRILGSLTNDGVLHDRIAEVVNDCRDGEYAT
jgi:hypothetical protein